MKNCNDVSNRRENGWLFKLVDRMKKNLSRGKRRYKKVEKVHYANNEPYEERWRTLFLEACYPRYAVFYTPTFAGNVYESFPYDVIRETILEDF